MKLSSRRMAMTALAVGMALVASACQVNGGATLVPIDDIIELPLPGLPGVEVEGTAILAVTSQVNLTEGSESFRSAGTFRNRDAGIAFTFRVRNADLNPLAAAAVPQVASSLGMSTSSLVCTAFAGIIGRVTNIEDAQGLAFGIVISDGSRTAVVIIAVGGPTGGNMSEPYVYAGEVAKGKLNIRGGFEGCSLDG